MTRMTAKRALLEQLVVDGVTHVFGNPGTTEQGFMDLLQDYPQIRYVLALHESAAVGMADAYARATGTPSFVELHIAPGLGNAMGMLYDAYEGGSPMVVYVGQQDTRGSMQEPILHGNLVEMARPVTKWAVEAQRGEDVPMLLRRAFKVAAEPPQGPVLFSVPLDVFDEEGEMIIEPTSYVDWRSRPSVESTRRAVDLIGRASNPVIVVGDGVALSGAQREVTEMAEAIGARIMTAFASEMNVATDHRLFAGMLGIFAPEMVRAQLEGVDLLLAIGTPVFTQLFPRAGRLLPDETRLVHIDLDPWEIAKNYPVELGVLADPKAALRDIVDRLAETASDDFAARARARAESIAEGLRKFREMAAQQVDENWDATPISVTRLMKELADALPSDAIVFDEAITSSQVLHRYVPFTEPGSVFRARGGGLGPGMPGAIGVKLARPDRPVVGVVGDGSAMYTIQSIWSAAHHDVPVTWVICNNESYRILKINMLQYLGEAAQGRRFVEMDLNDPRIDFAAVARSFGVEGWRVERPDEIGPALRAAFSSGKPGLVDVVIDGSLGPLFG